MRRLVLALVVLGTTGIAAGDPAAKATKLFNEGRVLAERGEWDVACVLFAESDQLDHQPGTGLNLAECAERAGEPRKAWLLFGTAAVEYETAGKIVQAKFARKRADALAPLLATVIVRVEKPTTRTLAIQIADREVLPASEIIERLDPGQVKITATARGREPFETTVTAILGREIVVEVPRLQRSGGAAEEEPLPPPPSGSRPWRPIFFTTLGVTIGTSAFTVYATARTKSEAEQVEVQVGGGSVTDDDCGNQSRVISDRGGHFAAACKWDSRRNTALYFSLGLTVVVLATAYLAFRSDDGADHPQRVSITPSISHESAGALVQIEW